MSKTQSFLKHAAVYGLGSMSVQLASIVLLPVYARHLTTADYGILQLIYRIGEVMNICLMVNGIKLATLNVWGTADDEDERRHTAASATLLTSSVLLVGGVTLLVGGRHLASYLGCSVGIVSVGILAIMMQATTAMPLALMQARFESTMFVSATLGMAVSQMTLAIITVAVLGWGIWGIVLSIFLVNTIGGAVLTLRELIRSTFVPASNEIRRLIRFSAPFIPSCLCFFVLHNGDQFFLMEYSGAAVLGIYALAYRVATVVSVVAFDPMMLVWSAWMYRIYKKPDCSEILGTAVTRIMAPFIYVGTALILFEHEAVVTLGSVKFAASAGLIAPLVLAHFFLCVSNLFDSVFYVTGRTGVKPWIAGASTIVMLSAYALLIPRYHAMGAAVATVTGFVFHSLLTLVVAQRMFHVHYEYRRLVTMLISSVVFVLLGNSLPSGAVQILVKALLILLFPALLWILGVVSAEEKCLVIDGVRRAWHFVRRVTSHEPSRFTS